MVEIESIESQVRAIKARIHRAAESSGRSGTDVKFLGVTKTRSVSEIDEALHTGLLWAIGENRVQEAMEKFKAWAPEPPVPRHLIGHLQSNKARKALELFDWIQSLDSRSLAQTLNRLASETGKAPYPVLIEVNTSGEASKHGVAPEEALDFSLFVLNSCQSLELKGFMTIGPLTDDKSTIAKAFESLRILRDTGSKETGLPLKELSMGMSGDFETAIEQGSTIVRIGTAIFGERERR